MNHRVVTLAAAAVLTLGVIACSEDDEPTGPVNNKVNLTATLTGGAEVPAVTTTATGTFTATLDTVTNAFIYTTTYSGLGSNVTLGHIHGPAATGVNASPIVNFATVAGGTFTIGATSGTATGSLTLNSSNMITTTVSGDSLKKLLLNGNAYVNIHTATNAGGEIRGQVLKQ
jgi:hypothetical protein